MGEAVADVSKLALLDVLLDGVEKLLLGDLLGKSTSQQGITFRRCQAREEHGNHHTTLQLLDKMQLISPYLKLSIGPSGNLDNHVQDGLLLVGIEGNIVEGRDGHAILLDVDAVLEGVGSRDLADAVSGSHCVIRRR